jgi:transglutaminase-like putative cysteine protease
MTTAYDILEDIRKGDILEYSYTIHGVNPIYKGISYHEIPLRMYEKMGRYRRRILFDKNQNYNIQCSEGDPNHHIKSETNEDHTELLVDYIADQSVDFEYDVPPWYNIQPYCHISTLDDWKQVGEWAEEVFSFTDDQDIKEVFAEIYDGGESKERQIIKAIDFVQNEIRYMGVESGIGSHRPFPPVQVLKQRYGDCKDKSLLLVHMMEELGVEAYPLLVSTTLRHRVKELPPSPFHFDHVIVVYYYDGKTFFVDPTNSSQGGGIGVRKVFDFGSGFIVGKSEFVDAPIDMDYGTVRVEETISLNSVEKKGTFTVKTTMTGSDADMIRSRIEYSSLSDISDAYRQTYSVLFPRITSSQDLIVEDNTEQNIITVTEKYDIPEPFTDKEVEGKKYNLFHYEPLAIGDFIAVQSCEVKQHPVYLGDRYRFFQTTRIQSDIPVVVEEYELLYDNKGFYYSSRLKGKDLNNVVIDYEFRKKNDVISPEEFTDYCRDMNLLIDRTAFQLHFPVIQSVRDIHIPVPPRK